MQLWTHQKTCIKIAGKTPGHIFDVPTGGGKTLIELEIINRSKKSEQWIVITKKQIIPTWMRAARDLFPKIRVATIAKGYDLKKDLKKVLEAWGLEAKGKKAQLREKVKQKAKVLVINPEIFHKLIHDPTLKNHRLIVDESDILCNPHSGISKAVESFAASRRYLLSGTPWDTPYQMFQPIKIVDDGQSLGRNYYNFERKYGIRDFAKERFIKYKTGRFIPKYKPKDNAKDLILEKARHLIFSADKKEILPDLPELQEINRWGRRPKNLDPWDWRDVTKKSDGKIDKGQLMMCRTLASGFVYDDSEEGKKKALELHTEKLDLLVELLHELRNENKILLWVQFDHEEEMLKKFWEKNKKKVDFELLIGHNYREGSQAAIDEFIGSPKTQILAGKPAAMGRGVDGLQKVCSTQIWYSASYEARVYRQATDRLHRAGQKNKTKVYRLIIEDTIEPEIYRAIDQKIDFQDLLKEATKDEN